MAKQKTKKRTRPEIDGVYFLKLVLYLVVGAQWVRITNSAQSSQWPIPVGLVIGLLFASHEHFQIDRKVEYAVLIVAMFVGFWLPIGISVIR